MAPNLAGVSQEADVRDQPGKHAFAPNVRDQMPASALRSPAPKVFKLFADPTVVTKAPTRFEGEIIGCWSCPLHSAALWLAKQGFASRDDMIETWREGRGRPDYILERSTVDRAARLHVAEGEAIFTAGEWEARQRARIARVPVGVAA